MMRKLEIGPGGRLEGIQLIGFHGEINPSRTPARCGPIYADEAHRLVRVERIEPSTTVETRPSVWLRVGAPIGEGSIPGHATRLDVALPAFLDHLIIVVGRDERAHASALRGVELASDTALLRQFMDWFTAAEAEAPGDLLAQKLGDAVAWYCAPKDAYGLHQRITHVATSELTRVARARDDKALYQAAWWLSRAGLEDTHQFLAVAALENCDPAMADDFLKGAFPRKPREEIDAQLSRARIVFQNLCRWTEQPPIRATPNIGSLGGHRNNVRRNSVVRRAIAA